MTPSPIIDASWQLYRKYFRWYAIPIVLLMVSGASAVLSSNEPPSSPAEILVLILAMLIFSWMDGSFVVLAAHALQKKPGDVPGALASSLKILGPLVALSFITQFLIAGGAILLVIPGVILAYLFSLALPALVLGGHGLFASIGESARMLAQKNNLWQRILAIVAPWVFWQIVLFLGIGILVMLAGVLARAFPTELGALASRTTFLLIIVLLSSLIRPLILTCLVMVYQSLTPKPTSDL